MLPKKERWEYTTGLVLTRPNDPPNHAAVSDELNLAHSATKSGSVKKILLCSRAQRSATRLFRGNIGIDFRLFPSAFFVAGNIVLVGFYRHHFAP